MAEEKLSLKGLEGMRRSEFLKKYAQYESVNSQVGELEDQCSKLDKDIRDAFYVSGTSKDGDRTVLHIVTSGKEGEEGARGTLRELAEAENIDIDNTTAERYSENDPESMKKLMERAERFVARENERLDKKYESEEKEGESESENENKEVEMERYLANLVKEYEKHGESEDNEVEKERAMRFIAKELMKLDSEKSEGGE